ncbi:MAG: hypothetical protein ACUBOA_01930 [Candidatus Loosdrechtia sp.]|uniref:hypothetical protein n=1 Tax=Candidatus Loosdrechtia sp. TaxID=3101272 RepID=UPI003A64F80C|nr:MAG: hypothetical protein QY305_13705 [Candidatus Jettenia sp. AMX2]
MRYLFFISVLIGALNSYIITAKGIFAGEGYTETEVVDGGSIIGTVKYKGDLLATVLNLPGAFELPDTSVPASDKIVVNRFNNGLSFVVISIAGITQGKKKEIPAIRPVIDQQKNTFVPRVVAILVGTTIDILNGDEELHTIHTRSVKNQPFNLGTSYKQRISRTFDYPETIKLFCDIHKKSYCWIVILENPYFDITDKRGYFEISDIPPGTYKLKTWHEELGNLEKEVTINPGEIIEVEFVYS